MKTNHRINDKIPQYTSEGYMVEIFERRYYTVYNYNNLNHIFCKRDYQAHPLTLNTFINTYVQQG